MVEKKARRLLEDGTSLSPANEQVRKTAAALDYTVSRGATNPALAIHPASCADLLPIGQMPMTHFPVAFLLVSFADSGVGGFTQPRKRKKKKLL